MLFLDNCDQGDTAARVEFSAFWNIGSTAVPFIDCVTSRNPNYEYYASGRPECYWSPVSFRGWVPLTVGGGSADPYDYAGQLALMGF
jgi:hypothetical protein